MAEPSQKTAFLIVGLPRSGTSSIAQLLDNLGVYFGDPGHFLDSSILKHNPIFYELQWINDFNDRIFDTWNSSYTQEVMPSEEDFALSGLEPLRRELRDKLAQEFGDRSRIGVKDPRICFTFPLWKQVLTEMGYQVKTILTLRDPSAILRSNRALMQGRTSRWQRFYARHVLAVRYFTRNEPVVQFDYDLLMQHPISYSKAKAAELGLEIPDPAAATAHLSNAHYHQQPDRRGTGDPWVDRIDAELRASTLDPQEYSRFRAVGLLFTKDLEEQDEEIEKALKIKDSYIRDVESLNRSAAEALSEKERQIADLEARHQNDLMGLATAKDEHIAKLEIMVRESAEQQKQLREAIYQLQKDLKQALEDLQLSRANIELLASEKSALHAEYRELEQQAAALTKQVNDLHARRLVRFMHFTDRLRRNRPAAAQ